MYKPGSHIDIWVVDRALGRGGMGTVYRCHNEAAKRILAAVKVLEGDINANEDAKVRFIREAEILFQLDHPNIVKVRNVRTDGIPAYIEMEFVEGQSLESMIRKGPVSPLNSLEFVRQITGAIAYMHGKGVCHRDIKPANLLVTDDGNVKLVDFGLAMESDVTRITQHGMAFGTVSYAPPEWITPEKLNPKSWDIYSTGVVFYEMLLGKLAFPVSGQGTVRQQAMQVIIGKQNAEALDPGPGFHKEIRRVIRKMTDKNPENRPETAYIIYRNLTKIQESITGTPSMNPHFPQDPISGWKTQRGAPVRSDTPGDSPLPSQTITLPPTKLWRPSILTIAAFLFVISIAIGVGISSAVLFPLFTNTERAIQVELEGIDELLPALVRLGDFSPTRAKGLIHDFEQIPIEDYTLEAVLGGCNFSQCPGDECPSWCSVQSQIVKVPRGQGVLRLPIPLSAPPQRAVSITIPNIAPKWIGTLTLNDSPATWNPEASLFQTAPLTAGQYPLSLTLGTCEQASLGCHERSDCPPGCLSTQQSLDIPWEDGDLTINLDLPEPTPIIKAPVRVKPSASRRGGLITHRVYASWLKTNPDWLPEAAVARKRADSGYLSGWIDALPPPGKGDKPIVNISGYAAFQFCRSKSKSIPTVDNSPTSWAEAPGKPSFEWRQLNKKLVLLEASGQVITNVKMSAINQLTGFRCSN